jgi:hypothetical protein
MAGNEEPKLLTEHEIAVLKNLDLAEEMLAAFENWIFWTCFEPKNREPPCIMINICISYLLIKKKLPYLS